MSENDTEPTANPNPEGLAISQALRDASKNTASVLSKPRFNIKGGTVVDIDPDDSAETWFLGSEKFDCPNCQGDKHRFHDMFLTFEGSDIITATAYKVCADCLLETRGETEPIGSAHQPKVGAQTPMAGDRKKKQRMRKR